MHPLLLSRLVADGVLKKRDRVLYLCDVNSAGYEWLRCRRFKVQGIATLPDASSPATSVHTRHEVVLSETIIDASVDLASCYPAWRDAMRHVRPGGVLLLFLRCNRSDDTRTEKAAAYLASCFPGSRIELLDAMVHAGPEPGRMYRIKKKGAYIPRLPVEYIDTPKRFATICTQLAMEKYVGLDVETTLQEPRILCMVQLATEFNIYLVDTLVLKNLAPLKLVMETPNVLKLIHNKTFESSVLKQYGIQINTIYDTCVESRKRYKKNKGQFRHRLSDVCERELGLYLDKSLQTSDWTRRPLTQEQCNYAAADAEVLVRLYHVFSPPEPPTTGELF